MVYKDVNNDGITDVVFTFKAKDVTKVPLPAPPWTSGSTPRSTAIA